MDSWQLGEEKRPLGAGEATSLAYRDDADETQIRGPQAIPYLGLIFIIPRKLDIISVC